MFKIASVSGAQPRPRWGSLRAPSDPLVIRGFLPSASAASRLRRLQYPIPCSDVLLSIPHAGSRPWLCLLYLAPNLNALATPLVMLKPSIGHAQGLSPP